MNRHRSHQERGQALIEFALIAPLFILFLLVIFDVGLALDRRVTLQHAVREGARYAALSIDNDFICQRTVDQSGDLLEIEDVIITYDDIDGNGAVTDAGDAVNVSVEYTYNFPVMSGIVNFFGAFSPSVDISPTGSARLERQHPSEFECPP
jgi:Flp pilus assembly protein TadG